MREELFAHLEASFEEERAHLGDDRAASERAILRLGEAGALTRSLQDSVPWLERVLFTRLTPDYHFENRGRRRRDETVLRYAIRITTWMTAVIAVADFFVLLVSAATSDRPMDWRMAFTWITAQLAFIGAGTFLFPFLWEAMVRALQGGSSRRYGCRPALVAALSSLVVIALTLAFVLIVTVMSPYGQVFRRSDWPVVLVMALYGPVMLILGAPDTISWRRRDGWDRSEISS
jgi:hypothetical protein